MYTYKFYCFVCALTISIVVNVSNGVSLKEFLRILSYNVFICTYLKFTNFQNVVKRSVEVNESEIKTDLFKTPLIPHDALNILTDPALDSPLNEIKRTVNVIQQKRDFIQNEEPKIPVPIDIEQIRKIAQILGIIINEVNTVKSKSPFRIKHIIF